LSFVYFLVVILSLFVSTGAIDCMQRLVSVCPVLDSAHSHILATCSTHTHTILMTLIKVHLSWPRCTYP